MLLVHEERTDRARSRVQILVITPHGEVDIPIMQLQLHISCCMRTIPTNLDSFGVGMSGYGGDVKILARIELDTG